MIDFVTQTRLKHESRFVRTPEFQILFRRLLGRLSSLSRFHCGAPLKADFRELIDQAASIRLIQDDTRWTRWQRYSSRQDRRMEWEGIVGRATYEGRLRPLLEVPDTSDSSSMSATALHLAWGNIGQNRNRMALLCRNDASGTATAWPRAAGVAPIV